ncbi:hypothetical protein GYA27_00775 [candidate division WWE3 bacterium]|uniref:Lipoprotein n=1 Tax=candidate division WWE3 bacterium TaxID=2053526 RepID=A0A7X9DK55_UNCKA|nr:hypothetical protein [candidate division WWE3 bacterium]
MRLPYKKTLLLVVLVGLSVLLTACTKPESNQGQLPVHKNSPQVVIMDRVWNKYSNLKYKYSINVPKEYYIAQGSCLWKEEIQKYEYKTAPTESKIFENKNNTYIYPSIIYNLNESQQECTKIENTEESVNDSTKNSWKITAFEADTPEKIDSFIKTEYGDKCTLEVLKPSQKTGEFDVIIGKTQDCILDSAYFFKYSENTNTGVSIKMGNSFTFNSDTNFGNNAYDEAILGSFEFNE